MFGPALFAAVLAVLTALEYRFMLRTGRRLLEDPAGAWPSGLTLGPHGWLLDASCVLSGILLTAFAAGLHRGVHRGPKTRPALLSLSGAAMALMAFETDPIWRTGPRSPHGLVHDASFVVFALSLLLSLVFLGLRMEGDRRWRGHARLTLATALVCAAWLALPGVGLLPLPRSDAAVDRGYGLAPLAAPVNVGVDAPEGPNGRAFPRANPAA